MFFIGSVQSLLDLEFLFDDAMCFVPVDFCVVGGAVFQANGRPTFKFAPIAWAVLFTKTRQVTNASAFGDDLNVGYLADDLEVQAALILLRYCLSSRFFLDVFHTFDILEVCVLCP